MFVHYFKAISEFKLELQFDMLVTLIHNARIRIKIISTLFFILWPYVDSNWSYSLKTSNSVKIDDFVSRVTLQFADDHDKQ